MNVAEVEAAIPNRADGVHYVTSVDVRWTRPDGVTLVEHGESLGVAVHRIEGGDRAYLALRTDELPLVLVPVSRIRHVEECTR